MIAQQVAGKATRDAMYLSSFSVKTLPAMMALSATASVVAVLWLSRLMLRHTPAKVVPLAFGASAVVLLGIWALSFPTPRLAAVALYLFTSLSGAALISAFWSLISETFDPHTSRSATTAIATGGTLGGLLGGLVAWRMSSFIAVPTMLPLLAGASVVALWGTMRLRRCDGIRAVTAKSAGDRRASETIADMTLGPLRTVRGAPYLRNLAAIVALGAVTSGLLDYVFNAQATRAFSRGPALLSFFSGFWLVVGVLTFLLQLFLGKWALEKLGVTLTVALLPVVVVLGGAIALAAPGLWTVSILRGGEAARRNSLFRAGYEMLYTSLSEERRRSTKTVIDVGFDRLGAVAAAGAVAVALALAGAQAEVYLLVLAIGVALVTLFRSLALHNGYVAVLEESLREGAARGGAAAPPATPMTERVAIRDEIVEHLGGFPHTRELAAIATSDVGRATDLVEDGRGQAGHCPAIERFDVSLRAVAELHSCDPERVRAVLSEETRLQGPVVSFAILLLADKDLHPEVTSGLRRIVLRSTGQLVDALCDDRSAFDVRRRIPRVLSACATQDSTDGLLRGLADARFEVRYECARALLEITGRAPALQVAPAVVFAAVTREVLLGKAARESQRGPHLEQKEDPPALVDRLLRDRVDRTLEHIFALLALLLDRQSLRLTFSALHGKDERRRGTALEYLDTVLPDEIRDEVWPLLGEARPLRSPRSAAEILADLHRAAGVRVLP
jgi:hypothetical protein